MRTFGIIALSATGTFLCVWLIASIAARVTGVPHSFPPFTALPLLSGVVGGFLGAWAVYALINAIAKQPDRVFFFVALFFLIASFGLPLRLSFTKSPRFAGVTLAAQLVLALLHTLIAASAVTTLAQTSASKSRGW